MPSEKVPAKAKAKKAKPKPRKVTHGSVVSAYAKSKPAGTSASSVARKKK